MLIMADYVDQVHVNDAMLSVNTFSVKEEPCQEDSFIDNKVCISETVITIDNAELQDKLKQYDTSTILDNLKTEVAPFEMTNMQNDNINIGQGINADNIKIEFDNGLLYCENCEAHYEDYCIECGMLVHILNKYALNNTDSRPREDIPHNILEIQHCLGQIGIYALRSIPAGVRFGPFTGLSTTECPWEINEEKFVVDRNKWKYLNWMQYINPTRNTSERNLRVFQCEDNIYYESTRPIQPHEELLVYFGDEYGSSPSKIDRVDIVTITKDIIKDVFACTLCCLGFSSKSHLTKHKTICIEDTTGTFSVEDLTQCPFCKIHLDLKEYFERHMAFCCERNARKYILPTPPAKQGTAALNGRKGYLRQIYKCEQCNYRTKFQSDLEKHHKQHCEVKMYKCAICNRRFKTKESLRLHVKKTHAYVGGKDDQEHSSTDHIKVEQASSQDQKKIFKCSLCVFQAKCNHHLKFHIKAIYLKQFDYKCDSCEFGTDRKDHLKLHIKSKHLKDVDYECDSCEYRTNSKYNLERHIKTKHLKKFDYQCGYCKYTTNIKCALERHIKTKHLKKFDYECGSCKFTTNSKCALEYHIKTKHLKKFDYECGSCKYTTNSKCALEYHNKTKHLKKFDYNCDSCEYSTNNKQNLKLHIKNKHLKEFYYKCDSCEYGTNSNADLKKHIKSKHLNEVDYKCDSCNYGTNRKENLKIHIKSKHLKTFDYQCNSCDFRSNNKNNLETHIKTKHLKKFDYKCDACKYTTNSKSALEYHIKTNHLKKFDFKCTSCEFGTNNKRNLELHVKTIHLKEFDFKCASCEFGTNNKHNLELHIQTKHLK